MKSTFEIFQKLRLESPTIKGGYPTASIPFIKNHKIGISETKQPIFFIKCQKDIHSKVLDINLEYISVQFCRQCQLINLRDNIEEGIYTIITLKADSEYLQEYFIKVVNILLLNIPYEPIISELKLEIDKLIVLFSKFTKLPLKTVQGLWAELLIIEQSNNPAYLIKSWHNSISDKYDFNDGFDKVEVKSTTKSRRIHTFSREQLTPNPGSRLLIASILVFETGTGKNIFNLVESIESKIQEENLAFRLNELIAMTIGKDFEKAFDIYFDYQFAVDSIRFYNSSDIPTIIEKCIPSNIMNLRFDCDLTEIETFAKDSSLSKLFNSLF